MNFPDDAKRDVRGRIRRGQQEIVFASPEALLGGLRPAVLDAAKAGLISLFAIDEAHMAVAWGEEFRTDFQMLAPLRNAMLELCPNPSNRFPTLLMSATLTAPVIERLAQDFGTDEPVEFVSGATLRPEPEYWVADPVDEAERTTRVLDAWRTCRAQRSFTPLARRMPSSGVDSYARTTFDDSRSSTVGPQTRTGWQRFTACAARRLPGRLPPDQLRPRDRHLRLRAWT